MTRADAATMAEEISGPMEKDPDEWILAIQMTLECVMRNKVKACSIWRISEKIREDNAKDKDKGIYNYRPKCVAIGPIHRGSRSDLPIMEETKWRYMHDLLSRPTQGKLETKVVQSCSKSIRKLESIIRASYAEKIEMASEELARNMLLDACFLLELLIKLSGTTHLSQLDHNINDEKKMVRVLTDLTLLENQIPFFLLTILSSMLFFDPEATTTLSNLSEDGRLSPQKLFFLISSPKNRVQQLHDQLSNAKKVLLAQGYSPEEQGPILGGLVEPLLAQGPSDLFHELFAQGLPNHVREFFNQGFPGHFQEFLAQAVPGHVREFFDQALSISARDPVQELFAGAIADVSRGVCHFLHLIHLCYPDPYQYRDTVNEHPLQLRRCARKLQAFGITIKARSTADYGANDIGPGTVASALREFMDEFDFIIHFDETERELTIPTLHIKEATEVRWRNFIAWEQIGGLIGVGYKFTSYAYFFKGLVCSVHDVQLLRKEGVIIAPTEVSNEDLLIMFQSIATGAKLMDGRYNSLCEDLNTTNVPGVAGWCWLILRMPWHYWRRFQEWLQRVLISMLRSFQSIYLQGPPWKFIGVVSGLTLLVLTTMQTIYTARSSH